MRARLVLVTDRAAMGAGGGLDPEAFGARIAAALAGVAPGDGVIVQVRDKAASGAALAGLVRAALAAAGGRARVIVNDRLDVALATGADGVHLPEAGLPVAVARALGRPGFTIGASRHAPTAARTALADGADLVHVGPIWATPSKAGLGEPLGPDALTGCRDLPVIAIGGVDGPARARAAIAAGASGVAVIRAVWAAPDPAAAVAGLLAAIA